MLFYTPCKGGNSKGLLGSFEESGSEMVRMGHSKLPWSFLDGLFLLTMLEKNCLADLSSRSRREEGWLFPVRIQGIALMPGDAKVAALLS